MTVTVEKIIRLTLLQPDVVATRLSIKGWSLRLRPLESVRGSTFTLTPPEKLRVLFQHRCPEKYVKDLFARNSCYCRADPTGNRLIRISELTEQRGAESAEHGMF